MLRGAILGGCFAVARAAQPGAVEPIAAPMRDLTWGQLNFLHTTDIHGWLGGHLLEYGLNYLILLRAWRADELTS